MFGLEVLTQNGLENLADILSLRIVDSFSTTQSTGNYTAPSLWDASRDTFFVVSSQGYQLPRITRSGNVLSWAPSYGASPVNFTFYLIAVNNPATSGDWGLVIQNPNAGIAIDQNYPALAIKGSGSSSGHIAVAGYSSYMHEIGCSQGDVVVVSLDASQYMANGPYYDGRRQIFHSANQIAYYVLTNNISGIVPASDGFGLQLFDPNGLIYDSSIPIMSIKAVLNDSVAGGISVTGLSSSDRFVACTSPFWIWSDEPVGGNPPIYQGTEMYYGVQRNGAGSLSIRAINGVPVQTGPIAVRGPIPVDAEMSVLVGKGAT